MSEEEIEQLIWLYGLKNAVKFDGKPNKKAIMGKLMASKPELRSQTKIIHPLLDRIVKEISKMRLEEQKKKLLQLDPHALDIEEKIEKKKEYTDFSALNL